MAHSATILADSVAPNGVRLTTFRLTIHRFALADITRHRMCSFSVSSSRAIPVAAFIRQVVQDPAVPIQWGSNKPGMQAGAELSGLRRWAVRRLWLAARWPAVLVALLMVWLGLHKQLVNRLLEPWMWTSVIISATSWSNFFALRDHEAAQPELAAVARMMRDAMQASAPRKLEEGEWHLPLVSDEERRDFSIYDARRVSVGRVAGTSYLRNDHDPCRARAIYERMAHETPMHASPFEHVAMALDKRNHNASGNFTGWLQYRKTFANEHIGGTRA